MSEKTKLELKLDKLEKDLNRQFLGAVREDCFIQDLQLRTIGIIERSDEFELTKYKDKFKDINYFKSEVYDKPNEELGQFLYKHIMKPSEKFRYEEYKKMKHKDIVLTKSVNGSTTFAYEVTNMLRDFYTTYGKDKRHPLIVSMVEKTINTSISRFKKGLDAKSYLRDKHIWGRASQTDAGKKAQKFLEDVADKYVYFYMERTLVRTPDFLTSKEQRDAEIFEYRKKTEEERKRQLEKFKQSELQKQNERIRKEEEKIKETKRKENERETKRRIEREKQRKWGINPKWSDRDNDGFER